MGWIAFAALLAACGSEMSTDGGAVVGDAGPSGSDAGGGADAGATVDAGTGPDGGGSTDAGSSADAGPELDAGAPTDGGLVTCGSDAPTGGRRLPASCEEARCHGTDACAMAMLAGWDFVGYAPCGTTATFDPASSDAICTSPPFFDYTYEPMCGRLDYSGTVRLFCDSGSDSVVAYFWGSFTEGLGGPLAVYHAGHEYEAGSGGGSGLVSLGEASADFTRIDFQGLEEGSEDDRLRVWFLAQDAIDPSITHTTGGFEVTLTP